jgi:hypothetical protein
VYKRLTKTSKRKEHLRHDYLTPGNENVWGPTGGRPCLPDVRRRSDPYSSRIEWLWKIGAVTADSRSIYSLSCAARLILGGKSALLRLILGLLCPDADEIRVDGTLVNAATRATLVRKIGYVVQEGALYPHLTASQNVTLVLRAANKGSKTDGIVQDAEISTPLL